MKKTSVSFNLKGRLIMARFYYHSSQFKASTKIYLPEGAMWNKKKQRSDHGPTNYELNEYESKLLAIYDFALKQGIPITNDYLKRMMAQGLTPEKKITLVTAFDLYDKAHQGLMAYSTLQRFKTVKTHLDSYQIERGIQITFSNFSVKIFNDFSNYLIGSGKLNNTVIKILKTLRKLLRWSREMGYSQNDEFLKCKVNQDDPTDIIHLTEQELDTLLMYKCKSDFERINLDNYLLRCFTGLRHSDLRNLKPESIRPDYILLTTIKTKDPIRVPLSPKAKAILAKYEDLSFVVRSNQKENEMLKKIMEAAKINTPILRVRYSGSKRIETPYKKWQLLTTHTARKTFVTLSRKRGMPDDMIMEITGIKDVKTLAKYKHIDEDQITEAMRNAWG